MLINSIQKLCLYNFEFKLSYLSWIVFNISRDTTVSNYAITRNYLDVS